MYLQNVYIHNGIIVYLEKDKNPVVNMIEPEEQHVK
jgi:hypothetical protein